MVQKLNNIPTYGNENTLYKNNKRITSAHNQIIDIGSAGAASVLDVCYPMGFNSVTSKHTPWVAPDPSVLVVDIASRTGGTWGMTVNSLVIANTAIAWNATAAVVAELLRVNGFNVTVTLVSKVYTITFNDPAQIVLIPATLSGDVTQLTGGSADATATETAGTSTSGADRIRGFINPEPTQTGVTAGSASAVVLTGTDTLCTMTTVAPHGLTIGETYSATMSGADEAKLNITATITILSQFTFSYPVAAVAGGPTEAAVAYTTSADVLSTMMTKGDVHYDDIASLIAAGSIAALQTALRADLMPDGLIIQGLTAVH